MKTIEQYHLLQQQPQQSGRNKTASYSSTSSYTLKKITDLEVRLRALAIDLSLARLLIFLHGHPHLLESADRGQDGPAHPRTEPSLHRSIRRYHFQPHGAGGSRREVSAQTVAESLRNIKIAIRHDIKLQDIIHRVPIN